MAFTTAQRDALEAAIARGVTSVTYDGIRTEYRSLSDMLELLGRMDAQLSEAAGTNVTRQILVKTKKGI